MKRNLKTLGFALGAMFALGALLAAGASAQGERFHSTEENVILTGESEDPTFRIGNESTTKGLEVTCQKGTYEGTITGKESENGTFTSSEVTVHPIYDYPGECTTPVGKATVDTNGCDYVLTSEYSGEHAPVEVECTSGKTIEITATGCTIKIGGGFYAGHPEEEGNSYGDITENTLTQGVTYKNLGESHPETTITVDATVDNIPYTSSGFLCGFAGIPKEGHNGFYEDDVVVEGLKDEKACTTNATTHVLEGCEEGVETAIWWE